MNNTDIYGLTYFVPTPVWEMFQIRVRDYRFLGVGHVVYYLVEAYRKQYEGEKNSVVMRKILKHATEDWFVLFKYDERSQSVIRVNRDWAVKIGEIASASGYKDRSRLIAVLIGCFVSSPGSLLKKMCLEMDQRNIDISSGLEILSTYVGYYQYAVLGVVAKRLNLSISGLLNSLFDIVIRCEDESADLTVSGDIRDLINDVLTIKGYTVKDFRREKDISMFISEKKRMSILQLIKKYNISTPSEFLRRLVLFFLNAQYVLLKNGDQFLINKDEGKEEDEMFREYQKRDYVRNNLIRI